MKRTIRLLPLFLIPLTGIILFLNSADPEVNRAIEQNTKDKKLVHDGPYVFWIGDRAIVQYYCDGEIKTLEFEGQKSIQIPASCENSSSTLTILAKPPEPAPDTFTGVTKICAVSDIHGKFDQMTKLLRSNGIIDANHQWAWGDGHLVIVGDVFDRGAYMNEALWLIYQLEKEAKQSGGRVHTVLGNHEVLVLRGDLRYVHKKYLKDVSKKFKITVDDLYGPETELGRWLRSKNVIIKLNDILFVHAGISPEIPGRGYSIQRINKMIRNSLDVRDYYIRFDEELQLLYGYEGPIWYRGYIKNWQGIPQATEDQVSSILAYYNAGAIAVGHTIVDSLTSYYGGRVFAIETGINKGKEGEMLIWEDGTFYRADVHGRRKVLK